MIIDLYLHVKKAQPRGIADCLCDCANVQISLRNVICTTLPVRFCGELNFRQENKEVCLCISPLP